MIETKKKQEEGKRKRKVEGRKTLQDDFEKRGKKSAQQAIEAESAASPRHAIGAPKAWKEPTLRLLSKLRDGDPGEEMSESH